MTLNAQKTAYIISRTKKGVEEVADKVTTGTLDGKEVNFINLDANNTDGERVEVEETPVEVPTDETV